MTPLNLLLKRQAFKQTLETARPRLYRMAFSWCNDPHLADDLVQDTMIKALKAYSKLKHFDAIDGWLFRILTNCWRDHFKTLRQTENIEHHEQTDYHTPLHEVEQDNIVEKVRTAITALPEGQRQVMTLVDLENMSYAEVAEVLEIPVGTVMSRLCRARNTLAKQLLDLQPVGNTTRTHLRRIK